MHRGRAPDLVVHNAQQPPEPQVRAAMTSRRAPVAQATGVGSGQPVLNQKRIPYPVHMRCAPLGGIGRICDSFRSPIVSVVLQWADLDPCDYRRVLLVLQYEQLSVG